MNKIFYISKVIILFLIISTETSCQKTSLLPKDDFYPRWLKSGEYHTDQTSGITFLGLNEFKDKVFLLADDVGTIHRLTISRDTLFTFFRLVFSNQVQEFLSQMSKRDFEEIFFDKYTGSVYLSIEGNKPEPQKYVGIYRLTFNDFSPYSDTIIAIEKLDIQPENNFLKYVENNIGFEGAAADEKYFYFGLEGFQKNNRFADSTILYIVDKKTLLIQKEIGTKALGITTICGLYSDKNNSLWGVDRNRQTIFHLEFDQNMSVINRRFLGFISRIPNYTDISYIAAIESITMDNNGYLYLVDDPWRQFYIPMDYLLTKLDEETVNNFNNYIPIIYRYQIAK